MVVLYHISALLRKGVFERSGKVERGKSGKVEKWKGGKVERFAQSASSALGVESVLRKVRDMRRCAA